MFEQLCKSEYSISKFLKAVQDQDDLHENQIKFFQESEQLLKKYYQEKLKYCLQQIKLRDQPKVSVEIQTDDSYDRMIKEKLEENLEQHATKLGKPLNFRGCVEQFYT
jgi:predicted metal-dependent hydrolase